MKLSLKINKPQLTDYQKNFLYNQARFTFTEASTKCGKTFSHIYWIYERAHEDWNKQGYNHWWVAPVYSQTKIAFDRLKRKIANTGNAYQINESNKTIVCPNGAIISFRSADKPNNLYGDDVYSIVFDEAPRAKVDAYYALRSTITATGGKIKLIGNFGGTANWMHQIKEKSKNDEKYQYYKVTAYDAVEAGILEADEIEQAKKDLPDKIFKQLYLAEETESEDQLISFDTMQSMFTNDFVKEGEKYITADIALHGSDKFVLIVWNGWKVIDFNSFDKTDAKQVENIIKHKALTYDVQRRNITYDADGLGTYLNSYLKGAKPFNNGAKPVSNPNYKNLKSECGYLFAKQCNDEGIYIDCEIDKSNLFTELECLRSYNLDNEGKMQIMPKAKVKELIGHSPDILDAFIMRIYFNLNRKPKSFIY
jgi:hypothetical protein